MSRSAAPEAVQGALERLDPAGFFLALGPVAVLIGLAIATTLLVGVVRLVRAPGHVRRELVRLGYEVRRLETRWFTRGPFREMGLPSGFRHADRLWRADVADRGGVRQVLWVRESRRPGATLEVRAPVAGTGRQGLGAAAFGVLLLACAVGGLWVWVEMGWFAALRARLP